MKKVNNNKKIDSDNNKSKVGNHSRGGPEGFLFNSYYTKG